MAVPAPTPAAWAAAERNLQAAATRAGDDRTRNGLTKRAPRNRTGSATQGSFPGSTVGGVVDETAVPRLPTGSPGGPPTRPVDDSPERVRDRMLSLRDGFQRKEREKANDER